MKSSLHPLPEREALFPSGSAASVPPGLRPSVTDLDIVIPVYDGERVLAASVRRLHSFLSEEFPFSWRIIIADNASTDRTPVIAARLSDELPAVRMLRLEAKGRGRALRAAWSASDARAVCYMDADLSTDLNGLLPLVAPLLSGHSDLAIGTRLGRARHTGDQARVHLALLQPPAAPSAAREVQRCPVRLQGTPRRHRGWAAFRSTRRSLVLRHRAFDPRSAPRAAYPRTSRRLGRRSSVERGHRGHHAGRSARRRAAGSRYADRSLRCRRDRLDGRVCAPAPGANDAARLRSGQRGRAGHHRGSKHGREPARDFRRARPRGSAGPARGRCARVRDRARTDQRSAGCVAWPGAAGPARARARRPSRRDPSRDRDPLCDAALLGVQGRTTRAQPTRSTESLFTT